MYYILFNNQSGKKLIERRINRLYKKYSRSDTSYLINLSDIEGQELNFINGLNKDDVVIICGGDGTVDIFINRIYKANIECHIYVYPCGSGNDLARDFHHKMFEITDYISSFPKCIINDKDESRFINGIGMGVDALVCRNKANYKMAEMKKSYFRISLEAIKSFRVYSLDIVVDGVSYHFDNVWFFVINHGRYMGGGMKVAPKAKRTDGVLDLCVVHDLSRLKLLMLFPFVYIGKHIFAKKHVFYLQGKKFSVNPNRCHSLQRDGEVFEGIAKLEVETK